MKIDEALLFLKSFVSMYNVTKLVRPDSVDGENDIMVQSIDLICDEYIKLKKEK